MRVRRSASGIAFVELTALLFILGMVLWGTVDFARLFYEGIKVTDGSRAGAAWSMQSNGHTVDATGIEEKAGHGAQDISGFSTTSQPRCWCDDLCCDDNDEVDCQTGTCTQGVSLQVWSEVSATDLAP